MKTLLKSGVILTALLGFSVAVQAVTVQDSKGEFSYDGIPQRVVALEYSYVDALAQVGISPVGVADENDHTRILQQVRDKIQPWQSVGTRSQPSLEVIASLKPDLIIADDNRHTAVYEELKKIAPTVVFNSRQEGYTENLETAQKIGELVGKGDEMKARIDTHKKKIAEIADMIPNKGEKAIVGIARDTQFHLYNNQSYAGGLLEALGFVMPKAIEQNKPNAVVGLEQVVAEKPDFIVLVPYRDGGIAKKWEKEALWKLIPAVQNNRILTVNEHLWARARGMEAAEIMAEEVRDFVTKAK